MKTLRPTYQNFKTEALNDPEIRSEYEAFKPIFELKKQMIKARLEANLSQEDVAKILHTQKSNISRLESLNSTHFPNFGTLIDYAKAVGLQLEVNLKKVSVVR